MAVLAPDHLSRSIHILNIVEPLLRHKKISLFFIFSNKEKDIKELSLFNPWTYLNFKFVRLIKMSFLSSKMSLLLFKFFLDQTLHKRLMAYGLYDEIYIVWYFFMLISSRFLFIMFKFFTLTLYFCLFLKNFHLS